MAYPGRSSPRALQAANVASRGRGTCPYFSISPCPVPNTKGQKSSGESLDARQEVARAAPDLLSSAQARRAAGGRIAVSARWSATGSAGPGGPGCVTAGAGPLVSIVTASGHGACVAAICRATATSASETPPALAASRRSTMSAGAVHSSTTRSACAVPASSAAAARRPGDSQDASTMTDSPRASSRPARLSSSR